MDPTITNHKLVTPTSLKYDIGAGDLDQAARLIVISAQRKVGRGVDLELEGGNVVLQEVSETASPVGQDLRVRSQ